MAAEIEKFLNITMTGTKTLIMNSTRGINPLNPLVKELRELTAKHVKTEADLARISDIEWELSLYFEPEDNIMLYLPAENIERCAIEGAKSFRKGANFEKGFRCVEERNKLNIFTDYTLEQLRADGAYRDIRVMTVKKAKIVRTRGRFNRWECKFLVKYDPGILELNHIAKAFDYAGKYVGICDSRQRGYGRFNTTIEEVN